MVTGARRHVQSRNRTLNGHKTRAPRP